MDATIGNDLSDQAARPTPRHIELIVDAIKAAITSPGEHRLFRSGKLPGLFPLRIGPFAEAALLALRDGLLETVRTDVKGKIVTEWVKATPRGLDFAHEHDSPKSVLNELKSLLDTTRAGIPAWLENARGELARLATQFEEQAAATLRRLDEIAERVESALRRADVNGPTCGEAVSKLVPWAMEALAYLDQRNQQRVPGDCPLPELFAALRERHPEITLPTFHDGLRRLHDIRALRLVPTPAPGEPEFAIVVDGQMMCAVRR